MTLRPIKAKHSSILKARRARLSNGRGHWGDFKPRFSLPRPSGKFSPFWGTKKGKATILILLSVSILFVTDQALKNPNTHGPLAGTSPIDPYTYLWQSDFNSLSGWNTQNVVKDTTTCAGTGGPCLKLQPNNPQNGYPAIAQTVAQINDLSPVSGKELGFQFGFIPLGTSAFVTMFYLTRNSTLPINMISYTPDTDPNVAFIIKVDNGGGTGSANVLVLIQKDPTKSIASEFGSGCGPNSSCIGSFTWSMITGSSFNTPDILLNYTGTAATGGNNGASGQLNCIPNPCAQGNIAFGVLTTQLPPSFFQGAAHFYMGLWEAVSSAQAIYMEGNGFSSNCLVASSGQGFINCMSIATVTPISPAPAPPTPTIDTGGFFGPIIKALINLGIFMLNAALQFVAFIAPGLQTGLSFMVSFYKTLFDILGNLIWPNSNLGTAIFNELANFVSWMVDSNNGLLAAFGNSTAIFGRFVDALKVTFPWLPTALAIALNLLTLAVNSVGEVITLVSLAMTLIVGGFAFYVIFFFFVYVGDDALGGVLGWMETMQWLIFNIGLAWTARISNYGLDIITAVIGIIPKPFVQMVAHQIPRIPIIETNARFVAPSFDFGEARAGNMFSYALWAIGLDFLAWYESRNPALPGSIGALVPSAVTPLLALNGMLPFLNLIVMVSWGACIAWMGTRALTLAGLDLFPDVGLTVGPGRKISSGPGGFKVSKGKKRFQGRTNKLVGERVKETEKEKKITEAFQEAARKNQEQVQVKKARETGERIAKEELARRQKAEPGAE